MKKDHHNRSPGLDFLTKISKSSSLFSSKQLHTTLNQAPKQTHYEDRSWITDDQRKSLTSPPPQLSSYNNAGNGNDRRTVIPAHHQDLQMNRQAPNQLNMFYYGDQTDEYHHSRHSDQQRSYNPSIDKHHQLKPRTLVDLKILS
jgi:hypothetical protein